MSEIISINRPPVCFKCKQLVSVKTLDGIDQYICSYFLSAIQYFLTEQLDRTKAIIPNVKECQAFTAIQEPIAKA